jgi:hypothetical protein
MLSKIRGRFSYVNVAMTVALVFAMTGGAYAANKYVVTSTKQISPKVLTSLRGKAGPQGSVGATGPTGPAGAPGPAGPKGENGANGTEGQSGKDGESVAGKAFAGSKGSCSAGGSEFTVGGKAVYACNGAPWPAGGTLPVGASETGQLGVAQFAKEGEFVDAGISFGIPLASVLSSTSVHTIENGEGEGEPNEATAIKNGECKGTLKEPHAASGNLCLFVAQIENLEAAILISHFGTNIMNEEANLPGAGKAGGVAEFRTTSGLGPTGGSAKVTGTWVVTG